MSPTPLLYRYDVGAADRWMVLDRDGTLTADEGYTHDPADLLILPGVREALTYLSGQGWGFVIASNQAGIARGLFTISQMEEFNDALVADLAASAVTVSGLAACPHHPDGSVAPFATRCLCRKPLKGLILALADQHDFRPEDAILVGNSTADQGAAAAAGMRFAWARDENDWQQLTQDLEGTL